VNDIRPLVVSRASVLQKDFRGDVKDLPAEMVPTDAEREWFKLVESTAPDVEIARRKSSICLDVEVETMTDDELTYIYAGKKVTVKTPANSFRVSRALESSRHDAVAAMCEQNAISVDGVPIRVEKCKLGVDEIATLVKVTDKFFFQSYL